MSPGAQLVLISRRSISRTFRQPVLVFPVVSFPLILLAVNAAGLASVTKLPGFPTDSYINFAIIVCFIQGAMFAAINSGTELAGDIKGGFTDRLALTPAHRWVVLAGATMGGTAIASMGTILYVIVGLIFGVRFQTGPAGALVLIVLAIYVAFAFSGIGAWLAVLTGSPQAVQGIFPLLFVLLFLSTSNLPLDFITTDWFRTIAEWNPLSWLIDGMRGLVITGWDLSTLLPAIAVATGVMLVFFTLASRGMRKTVQRT
ncbi:MAG: ABC transporter permease [Solirubrobacterales bacterium]